MTGVAVLFMLQLCWNLMYSTSIFNGGRDLLASSWGSSLALLNLDTAGNNTIEMYLQVASRSYVYKKCFFVTYAYKILCM